MSDREDSEQDNARRRRPRACDQCRRRKVRCDGSGEDGRTCSTCVSFKDKCTYTAQAEPRKRRYVDEEYVRALETEVTRLRLLVLQQQAKIESYEKSPISTTSSGSSPAYSPSSQPSPPAESHVKQEEPDDDAFFEGFKFMSLSDKKHVSFMGRSSNFPLMSAAIKMKQELVEGMAGPSPDANAHAGLSLCNRRPEFWLLISDVVAPDPPYTDFPEPALMKELLDNYFSTVHESFPLLHRPTFIQSVTSGLHLIDEGFGAVLLLVCALGARFSNNPAMLPPGATNWQWGGWQWFDQVRTARKLMQLSTTTLYDMQIAALSGAYVATLAVPHCNYSIVGHGIRLAQDLGAHRRMTYSATPSVESELRKRAFWCLIAMDRALCSVMGRPCSIQDEDFDIDYPIECDDDYWIANDPQKAFKQPPGKPSTVSYFKYSLKLTQIQTRALRTIYSLQGAKELRDPERAQQMVADLDSELNQWEASIPDHLRYSPSREDLPFATQAASLYASYCSLRIFIHRPFIMMTRGVPLPFPSLAICTNAARACIQALDRHLALSGPVLVYQYHLGSLFSASIILLLHMWQGMRSGRASDYSKEAEHVNRALRVFGSLETHWSLAGRFTDILTDLMSTIDSRRCVGAVFINGNHPSSGQPRSQPVSCFGPPPFGTEKPSPDRSEPMAYYGTAPDEWKAAALQTSLWGAAAGAPPTPPPGDPDLEALFADFLPTLENDDPLAALAQQCFPGEFASSTGMGAPQSQDYTAVWIGNSL